VERGGTWLSKGLCAGGEEDCRFRMSGDGARDIGGGYVVGIEHSDIYIPDEIPILAAR